MLRFLIFFLVFGSSGTFGIPSKSFLLYGTAKNDDKVPFGDDNHFEVQLKSPIKFFNNSFTKIFVNTNGVLSFGQDVSQYTPQQFPLPDKRFLAAFWADVDTRHNDGGIVYYRQSYDVSD